MKIVAVACSPRKGKTTGAALADPDVAGVIAETPCGRGLPAAGRGARLDV